MSSLKALLGFGLASLGLASLGLASLGLFAMHEGDDANNIPKYFVEPAGSLARRHYNLRFFKDEVRYDEHHDALRDLIRSYLATAGGGTSWDDDLDVQVSNYTLQWLGDNLNYTEHVYNSTSAGGELVTKTYLLDINPHHVDIDRGDSSNIIDGSWIDTDNGIFIDITGVRKRESNRPGSWTCKDQHRYAIQDLWPLHVTKFEGVRCRVPYNFQKVLVDEYGAKSLVTEEQRRFADQGNGSHRWDRVAKKWFKYLPRTRVSEKLRLQQLLGTRYKGPPVSTSDSSKEQ
ncbi:Protein MNN4 [Tolypocladium paradoxum]|uniref:Protein MNN4 n=1 Tax=Tolypocladium paradoxum TaxID=94208 RepID=A0A2S4KVJ5_9HYPO|nr:Protein MNN4 [Tolypocladium paradoxum]